MIVVTCIALFMPACGSSPKDLIVGKWEAGQQGTSLTAEFSNNAQATITMFGQKVQGTYKMHGDDELEWTLQGKTTRYKVKVTKTELELTSEGKTIKYRKA
jgi:hypothetical protein